VRVWFVHRPAANPGCEVLSAVCEGEAQVFLMAIRRAPAPDPLLSRSFAWMRVPAGDGFVCDVWTDGGAFELRKDDHQVAVVHRTAADGTVFRFRTDTGEGAIEKPLLLGLPVYVSATPEQVIASTHIRSLRSIGVPIAADEAVMAEYMLFRYITAPRTLFRGLAGVPVGGRVDVRVHGDRIVAAQPTWTRLFEGPVEQISFDESTERIAGALRQEVQRFAPVAHSVGCLLSGGVDSSILFTLCRDILGLRESSSAGYPFEDDKYNDERTYAESAAAALGSRHRYRSFDTAQFLDGVVDAIDHAELPVVALQSVLMELLQAKGLDAGTRTVLCGQGADGLFGLSTMYTYHHYRYAVRPVFAPALRLLARAVGRGGRLPDHRILFEKLAACASRTWDLDFQSTKHAVWLLGEFGDKDWIKQRYHADDRLLIQSRQHALSQFKLPSALDAFSVMDFVSDVTTIQDLWGKMAAAHGRFLHYPFNAPDLIRAAMATSWDQKLLEPKRLIRAVGRQIGVPQFILDRPKRGFGIGAARWALPGGVIEPLLTLATPVFDLDLLRRFQTPDERQAHTLWSLVNYAVWKRLLIDGESASALKEELRAAAGWSTVAAGAGHA
jgi:asparagine synthase (glutamine-hydrolysing)